MPIGPTAKLGRDVRIFQPDLVNIYGCVVGDETRIGPFVEIQSGVIVGKRCKIQSHVFICEGVTIADEVFIGHGVMFTNDLWPKATDEAGNLLGTDGWEMTPTHIGFRVAIGSGATILPVKIGEEALIGAGAVITRDVPPFAIMAGNPARIVGDIRERRPKPVQ